MKTHKLVPKVAAITAGLVGMAEACYTESSYVCVTQDQPIGSIQVLNCGWKTIFATSDWYQWNVVYEEHNGNPLLTTPTYCQGGGYWTDCNSFRHDGTYNDGNPPVYRVDYYTPCEE